MSRWSGTWKVIRTKIQSPVLAVRLFVLRYKRAVKAAANSAFMARLGCKYHKKG